MIRNGFHYTRKPPVGATIDRSHPLTRGLVAALLMMEGNGKTIYDATRNGADAVAASSPAPSWGAGVNGPVTAYSGSQYYQNTTYDFPTSAVTIVVFGAANDGLTSVIGNGTSGNPYYFNIHYPYSSGLYWRWGTGVNTAVAAPPGFFGTRHMSVFTADANASQIYIDGIAFMSGAGGVRTSLPGFTLGQWGSYFYDGNLEYVLVFNRVLTLVEIQLLSNDPYIFMSAPTVRRFLSSGPSTQFITAAGIESGETWGSPAFSVGAVTISPYGIGSQETWGSPIFIPSGATIVPASIISAEQWGQAQFVPGPVVISAAGIGSEEQWGEPILAAGGVAIFAAGIVSAERWGQARFGAPQTAIVLLPTTVNLGDDGRTSLQLGSNGKTTVVLQ